jgi:ATP-dependent Clp protease ATP-binding subunit ClpB
MSPDKFTVKLQEAFNASQSIATRHGHQELKPTHLLLALLEQDGGIAFPIFEKAALKPEKALDLKLHAAALLERQPKVSGGASGLHLSHEIRELMTKAEDEQKKLKDDFLSVEHVILALFKTKTELVDLLKQSSLSYDSVSKALSAVRGSQRVVDQDPEGKYQTLEKYGTDLTARAKAG